VDEENHFIWEAETTVANIHDGRVDLANVGEARYDNKSYHRAETKRYDAAIKEQQ